MIWYGEEDGEVVIFRYVDECAGRGVDEGQM